MQVNIEYWFRLLYDLFFGHDLSVSGLVGFFTHLWIWVIVLGYIIAAAGLAYVVYLSVQIFELRRREEAMYGPIHVAKDEGPLNPRWAHIESLMQSTSDSDWRQAIIEADILLGDMLTKQGYHGSSIGDQLKQVEPSDFDTLQNAWAAHKVRNDIAHEGSAFDLSPLVAQRTISQYETVFREFDAI